MSQVASPKPEAPFPRKFYMSTRTTGRRARRELAAWLRKKHNDDPRAEVLARRLMSCSANRRCISAACPSCGAAAQRWLAKRIAKAELATDAATYLVSVVLASIATDAQGLEAFNSNELFEPAGNACLKADVSWGIFAIDVSINEHRAGKYGSVFLPHLHGIVKTLDAERLRRELKLCFPANHTAPRPVRIDGWDGRRKMFRYPLKQKFDRRIGVDDAVRFNRRTGETRICRAVLHDRPRSSEKKEMLLFFERLGFGGRLEVFGNDVHVALCRAMDNLRRLN